jgi:hypothetical protein
MTFLRRGGNKNFKPAREQDDFSLAFVTDPARDTTGWFKPILSDGFTDMLYSVLLECKRRIHV